MMADLKLHIRLFFLAFILVVSSARAQFNDDFFIDTIQTLNVAFQANYSFGSTVMNNQFMNKFLFGGEIDRELKDEAYQNLNGNNRLGADFNYRLGVEIPFDTLFRKQNISLYLGVESYDHIDASYGDDLFRLAFDGNKQFAGETIDIGNANYNQFKYQSLSVGFINHKYFEHGLAKEGVIVSLIKGQEHQAITVPEGNLFTEQYGRELAVDINYVYNSTDTGNLGAMAFNGYGISTDLFTEFFMKNGDKMYMGVEDLGFIYWNSNSLELASDSTYKFDGVYINNIFDLNDSIFDKISKDTIVNSIAITNKKEDYSIALPTAINLTYTKTLNQKIKFNVGLYHKILSNYFPLLYTNTYYYFSSKLSAKIQLAYGGYGKFNSGLAIAKSFGKKLNFFIGTNNIEAFVLPDKAYANSGFVGLKTYF